MTNTQDPAGFFRMMQSPIKFRLYLFKKLPSAYFSGVRLKSIDENHCEVTVPFKWFSQNPFRSTYFACLSMAAEMSTGLLALAFLYKLNPPVSMLVLKVEGEFFKKATSVTTFTCSDGLMLKETIAESIRSGQGKIFRARSEGLNKDHEKVAEFFITWSFKVKRKVNKLTS